MKTFFPPFTPSLCLSFSALHLLHVKPVPDPGGLGQCLTGNFQCDEIVADTEGAGARTGASAAAASRAGWRGTTASAAGQTDLHAVEARACRALHLAHWATGRIGQHDPRVARVRAQVVVHDECVRLVRDFEELVPEEVIVHALRAEAVPRARL